MGPNFILFPLVAIIPMLVGFVWYNPKVFGTAWMAETGMTEEKAQQGRIVCLALMCGVVCQYCFSVTAG